MSTQISERALSTGLGVGALALLAQTQRASADTSFTNFAFNATGAGATRTMPDRLADIKNVKDFGAVGNGVANDTAAIQTAMNWAANIIGVIFFPPGTYKVTGTITLPQNNAETSFIIRGCGELSIIEASGFTGYVFQR